MSRQGPRAILTDRQMGRATDRDARPKHNGIIVPMQSRRDVVIVPVGILHGFGAHPPDFHAVGWSPPPLRVRFGTDSAMTR
jgi:hypothetical protein